MFSLESFLFMSVAMLAVGVIIGVVVGRSWVPPHQQREMELSLASAKKELATYQQNVAQHFMETSAKVGELTQSYRELHKHLTKGALQLGNTEIGREILAAGEALNIKESLDSVQIEAPKDWAPKKPGDHGMLSEEFGLNDTSPEDTVEPPPR